MMILTLHILLSALVGLCTYLAGRRGDFLMFFALSLVITPIFAMIILIVGTPRTIEMRDHVVKSNAEG